MLTKQAATRKDRNAGLSEMQHRHFATVATIINGMPDPSLTQRTKNTVARYFADQLALTNPRFDRSRFLTACGVEE